jgi:8-oxoguanine deaminase
VMIKGQWRVVDSAPLGVDVSRLRAQHGKAAKRFIE